MFNFRSYVSDEVRSELYASKITLTTGEIDSIIDSVIFDWNEIGDPEENLQEVIEWNIDQYLTHA